MEHKIVYKTALVYELDMVRDSLKEAQIQHFVQSEGYGGVKYALEAAPAQGFGKRWFVLVPETFEKKAEELLKTLPVSFDSDTKPFPVMDITKVRGFKWLITLMLSPLIIYILWNLYKLLKLLG